MLRRKYDLKEKHVYKLCDKQLRKLALSIDFFPYFACGIPFKHKAVIVQTPEWKFKANIARNATYEGC